MTLCSHSNNTVHIFIYVCMSNKIFFFCFFGYLWSIPGRCWNISNSLPVNMGDLHSTDVRIPIYWCGYGHIKPPSCISIAHTEPYLTILGWGRVISGPRTWEIHGTKIQPYYYNQISSFVLVPPSVVSPVRQTIVGRRWRVGGDLSVRTWRGVGDLSRP